MKSIFVGLLVLVFFLGCNKKEKELKALQIENEKSKAETQQLETERLLQQIKDEYRLAEQEIKSIAKFFDAYITDNDALPADSSLEEMSLNKDYVPFYVKAIPVYDPWDNKYQFLRSADEDKGYFIFSSGSDGIFNGLDQYLDGKWEIGTDIIWKNNEFVLGLSKAEKRQSKD